MSRYESNGKDSTFLSVRGEGKTFKDWVATEIRRGTTPDDAKEISDNADKCSSLAEVMDKYWPCKQSAKSVCDNRYSEKETSASCSGDKCEKKENKCDNCGKCQSHSGECHCGKHCSDTTNEQVDYFQLRLDEFKKRMDVARMEFDKALSDFESYKKACDNKAQIPSRKKTARECYETAKSRFFVDVVNELSREMERDFDLEFDRDGVEDMSDYTIFLPLKDAYVESFKILPHKGFELARKASASEAFLQLKKKYADVLDSLYVDFWTDFVDDDETSAGLLFTVSAFTEKQN